MDNAIEVFLERMMGDISTPLAFSRSNGIVQRWERFAFIIGSNRAVEISDSEASALGEEEITASIQAMLLHAFDRLSVGGRIRLANDLDEIEDMLIVAVAESMNPLVVSRDLSEKFDSYESWEFERLARTEIAFAQNRGQRDEFAALGFDSSFVDVESPPFHPNCLCALTLDPDLGLIIYDISAQACELCQSFLAVQEAYLEQHRQFVFTQE